ncbi:hypothetical protein O1611_g1506 [Lasiodiplodia mahajangana]|uniref:Uncharacterized protein n=1 Tax=Lasiodiplodia mahajangana TaxID=1108764 RepID=A0ACC2JXU4_9PEZI|nr:hypothetical protein O1611_g1506 [Lasiodiplodia mahajangana]
MCWQTRFSSFYLKGSADPIADVESAAYAPDSGSSVAPNDHELYMQLIFGCSDDTLSRYPGLHSYCQYMEGHFGPLLDKSYASIWNAIGLPRPASARDCWALPIAVLQSLRSEEKQPSDVSIDTILDHLLKEGSIPSNRAFLQVAIFAVLCWSSFTLEPDLQERCDHPKLACRLQTRLDHGLDRCKRAVSVAFRGFKMPAWGRYVMRGTPQDLDDEELYEASLNISSLQMFGKIHIRWVSTMTAHLEFDPASRCLSVFRFPSLCALRALSGDDDISPVIRSIIEEFDPLPAEDTIHRYITLEQEILLSFRLLFGQSTESRKIARQELNGLRGNGTAFDHFLTVLCERKYKKGCLWWAKVDGELQGLPASAWPGSCLDSDDNLQERDVYSAVEDFPRLGHRLLRVQKFNMRQRPNRLRDLWRDRRNPLQWYTFWAVLVIGGVANIIALLQLIAAVVQIKG